MANLFMAIKCETLDELKADYKDCKRCSLCANRTDIVFWDGMPGAEILVCGEAPGADEDRCGVPFSGRAGKRLNQLLHHAGTHRSSLHITNIVLCRPVQGGKNGKPTPMEAMTCQPRLFREIELVNPKAIICLGGYAASIILQQKRFPAPVGQMRGWHDADINGKTYKTFVSWHPAYELRRTQAGDYSTNREMFEDWQKVLEVVPEAQVLT